MGISRCVQLDSVAFKGIPKAYLQCSGLKVKSRLQGVWVLPTGPVSTFREALTLKWVLDEVKGT